MFHFILRHPVLWQRSVTVSSRDSTV